METAEHIAVHCGKTTIVEMRSEIATDMVATHKYFLMESLRKNEVEMLVNTKVLEIQDDGVVVEENGAPRMLPADLVVLAIGSRSSATLAKELEGKYPMTLVGDAFAVGKALDGINAAYKAALEL